VLFNFYLMILYLVILFEENNFLKIEYIFTEKGINKYIQIFL